MSTKIAYIFNTTIFARLPFSDRHMFFRKAKKQNSEKNKKHMLLYYKLFTNLLIFKKKRDKELAILE